MSLATPLSLVVGPMSIERCRPAVIVIVIVICVILGVIFDFDFLATWWLEHEYRELLI
jgi:hypothetical protein